MSALRVGTRVKKVRGTNLGITGTIVEVDSVDYGVRWDTDVAKTWDEWGRPAGPLPVGGTGWVYHSEVEPILRTPDAAEILSMQNLPEGPVREREYVNVR